MTFSFILFCSNSEPTGPHCCHINQTEKDRVWVPAGGCHFSVEEAGMGSCVNRLTFPGWRPLPYVPLLLPQQSAGSGSHRRASLPYGKMPLSSLERGGVRICPQDFLGKMEDSQNAQSRSRPELRMLARALEISIFVSSPNVPTSRHKLLLT